MTDLTDRLIDVSNEIEQIGESARSARSRIYSLLEEVATPDRLADSDMEGIGVQWSKLCRLRDRVRELRQERSKLRAEV